MQIGSTLTTIFGIILILAQKIPFDVGFENVPGIVFISIFGVGISGVLFMTSLRLIGAVRSILIYSTNIVFGVVFAGVFLGESVILINVLSITLSLIGIYLLRERLGHS